MDIRTYIKAAFPAVAIETVEEDRFIEHLCSVVPEKYSIYGIDASNQIEDLRAHTVTDRQGTYLKAFELAASKPRTLVVVSDWHHICHNAGAYRSLKRQLSKLEQNNSVIILLAPEWRLPPELIHDVPVLDFSLPDRDQLAHILGIIAQDCIRVNPNLPKYSVNDCVDAATGLTLMEAKNSFGLSYSELGAIEPTRIEQEKMRLVKSTGYLEVWNPVPVEKLGGLGELKQYFADEVLPVKDDLDLQVRGIMLLGPPGVGKSLAAKVSASILQRPLLRLDMASLKQSLVGQSESNMRHALKLVDAIAPAVILVDEAEKSIAGHQSSGYTDSGVTSGMLGILLTWLQEHTTPVFTVMTINDYAKLPPELTRAGRFDERFFVDLPIESERVEIARIHLIRLGCSEKFAPSIGHSTHGWTGAEIEQLVKSAARRTNRKLTKGALELAGRFIRPISRVRAQEIDALRSWAKDTLRMANSVESVGSGRAIQM